MFEIIIFIIIIVAVSKNAKKKTERHQSPPFTSRPNPPGGSSQARSAKTWPAKTQSSHSAKSLAEKAGKQAKANPIRPQPEVPLEERTFIEPTRPYRPARNAGQRYEEWMPVPEGQRVCHCGYCGADNLIPKNSDPKNFSCYFCREDL